MPNQEGVAPHPIRSSKAKCPVGKIFTFPPNIILFASHPPSRFYHPPQVPPNPCFPCLVPVVPNNILDRQFGTEIRLEQADSNLSRWIVYWLTDALLAPSTPSKAQEKRPWLGSGGSYTAN
ncbi:hypothetical protein PoB_000560600 [Plakobranchus ocellatus]|uniref:Uncharacterized protein n=1 Tax=Plakobranchus ocellatus TaxID=259542 RepID=A0AAV3XVS6_9GAST|nr:hypothetical protein PoB_000560600 [Plakobranchus ocellatus]